MVTFKWRIQQVNKVKSEIMKYTSMFSKLRHYLPKTCLTTLYDALVLSKISYAFEVYGCALIKSLKELQVLQNRILRILHFQDHRYPTYELHKETNCLKVSDLYEFKISKFMHHVHHNKGQLPAIFQNYFQQMTPYIDMKLVKVNTIKFTRQRKSGVTE